MRSFNEPGVQVADPLLGVSVGFYIESLGDLGDTKILVLKVGYSTVTYVFRSTIGSVEMAIWHGCGPLIGSGEENRTCFDD